MSEQNPANSPSQNPASDAKPAAKPAGPPGDDPCRQTKCPPPPKPEEEGEDEYADEGGDDDATDEDATAEPAPSPGGEAAAKASPARAELAKLKRKLEAEQRELQQLEPVKASVADLVQRIQALEKTVDGEAADEAKYKDFYRATEVQFSEYARIIESTRCDLKLSEDQKNCILRAIARVEARVQRAKRRSRNANKDVKELEKTYKAAEAELAWQKKVYDFLKSGAQAQVTKLRDDLKTLKPLADPTKDPCEVWFYLLEMEADLKPKDGVDQACWRPDLSIGDFLQCWPWADCYRDAWNRAIVDFNKAEAAEKRTKSELEQANKAAADLEKLAKEAETKRRDWILREIKDEGCCAPKAKSS